MRALISAVLVICVFSFSLAVGGCYLYKKAQGYLTASFENRKKIDDLIKKDLLIQRAKKLEIEPARNYETAKKTAVWAYERAKERGFELIDYKKGRDLIYMRLKATGSDFGDLKEIVPLALLWKMVKFDEKVEISKGRFEYIIGLYLPFLGEDR